ncbi:MAG: histidine kinase [Oscillospiraceae bacterium]
MQGNTVTIKRKIMFIVMIAIVVPFIFLMVFVKLYQDEILEKKRQDEVAVQAQYAAEMAAERITAAIKLSKDIVYEGAVEKYSTLHKKGEINEAQVYGYLTQTLKNKFYLNQEILFSAIVLKCNPNQIYSVTADGYNRINDFIRDVKPNLQEQTRQLQTKTGFFVYESHIYILRNLISTKTFEPYGVIVTEIKPSVFFKEFLNNNYFSDYTDITLEGSQVYLGAIDSENFEKDPSKVLSCTDTIKEKDFTLHYETKVMKYQLMEEERVLVLSVVGVVLLILVALSILLYRFYRSITVPIEQLTVAFKQMEQGDLGVTIPYEVGDELGFLIQGFNEMSVRIEHLINRVYKEELNLREAKIKALQSQINPHFVNNTLEIINWKAQMLGGERGTEISKMLRALSVIMRAQTGRNSNKIVKLREEISFLDSYLYILEHRFEKRIHIVKQIDTTLLDCEVPLLMIQPLLENAVVHGIEPAKGGTIEICIKQVEDELWISILNDGAPLTLQDERFIQSLLSGETQTKNQRSVGIRNVNERIQLIYGNHYGLTVRTNEDNMTESTVCIPYNVTNYSNKAQDCGVEPHE